MFSTRRDEAGGRRVATMTAGSRWAAGLPMPDEAERSARLRTLTGATVMMSPLQTVRSVLLDPLYRSECLQMSARRSRGMTAALTAPLAAAAPLLALVLPALWTAESVIHERQGGTLESLLLTPVDRQRLAWAKVLARLRPLVPLAACCPAAGALLGAAHGLGLDPGGTPAWPLRACLGALLGALAGAEALAFGFTAGAAGFLAALGAGGRIAVTLRALLCEAGVLACNCALLAVALLPAATVFAAPIACPLLFCKWLFFNWRRGAAIIDRAAGLMDRSLLGS